jgi:uncharacterized protein (DUF1919 family)
MRRSEANSISWAREKFRAAEFILYNFIYRILRKISYLAQKSRLKNKNFTVIANNCWAGELYKDFNLVYATPFVGLFIFAPCYIKMLKNLKAYLSSDLSFIDQSRYPEANELLAKKRYPVGLLGGDVEVHFLHYANAQEAKEKWSRRLKRVNWDNIFVKFCDRDCLSREPLNEFDKLDFKHKVCFTSQFYPDLKSALWISECKNEAHVMTGTLLYESSKKYFDVVNWLNGKEGKLRLSVRIFNDFVFSVEQYIQKRLSS